MKSLKPLLFTIIFSTVLGSQQYDFFERPYLMSRITATLNQYFKDMMVSNELLGEEKICKIALPDEKILKQKVTDIMKGHYQENSVISKMLSNRCYDSTSILIVIYSDFIHYCCLHPGRSAQAQQGLPILCNAILHNDPNPQFETHRFNEEVIKIRNLLFPNKL